MKIRNALARTEKKHMWQHRYEYENQNPENGQDECTEEGQFKNQNGNNSNGRGGK